MEFWAFAILFFSVRFLSVLTHLKTPPDSPLVGLVMAVFSSFCLASGDPLAF